MTTARRWYLDGQGYEFCDCEFGCGCNFGGFPNSRHGGCHAFVGMRVARGACGDVDLSGVKCGAIFRWPKAIHLGNGKAVFVLDLATTDAQAEALGQIFTGQLGGNPWDILGPTFEVVGLEKTKIVIEGSGRKTTFRAEGIGEGRGDTLKNPVTGEDHLVDVVLDKGFIWKRGQCGTGDFKAAAAGLSVGAEKTNWILYDFAWSSAA